MLLTDQYVFGPQEVAVSNYYAQMHLPESFRQTAQQAGALAVHGPCPEGIKETFVLVLSFA